MNTHLTRRGIWVLGSGLLWIGAGVTTGAPVIAYLGMLHIFALFMAALLCLAGALVLDRRHLRAELREPESPGGSRALGHVAGEPLETTLELTNEATIPLFGLELEAYAFRALEVEGLPELARLTPGESHTCELHVTAPQSGRWTLQGFDALVTDPFGWIRTQDYLPCRRGFVFYPNAGRLATSDRRRSESSSVEREGGDERIDRDTGLVIRELRDYQPGDPLRHIDWKATVRTRRLIAREFEDEIARPTMMLLDMSGSMRGGEHQGEKLEHAIELAAGLADALIQSRHPVGLTTFDEKVYGFLEAQSSRAHYHRLLNHLVELHSVVDPELTEFDEAELYEMLSDYLLVQDRLDFRSDDDSDQIDRELLRRWIEDRLDEERKQCDHTSLRTGVVDRDLSPEREFAQLRGLPVPYRVESRLGPKGRGLAEAFEYIIAQTHTSHEIVVLTDLCGLTNLEILESSLGLLRQHGHQTRFVVPFTPAYYRHSAESRGEERHDILLELFTAAEREERLEGVRFLQRKGIPVDLIGANLEEVSSPPTRDAS